jgi:hypothetical protein
MNPILKTLIIVTAVYYLVKGLIYLVLWQTTKKLEERGLEAKRKAKEKREKEAEIQAELWQRQKEDE